MAGGKGTRIGNPEKCLIVINKRTILDNLVSLLRKYVSGIYISVSKGMAATEKEAESYNLSIIRTEGRGYITDMNACFQVINDFPLFVVPGDIYVKDGKIFDMFIDMAKKSQKDIINLKSDGDFTGVSLFKKSSGSYEDIYFKSCIINVNTMEDARRAENMI